MGRLSRPAEQQSERKFEHIEAGSGRSVGDVHGDTINGESGDPGLGSGDVSCPAVVLETVKRSEHHHDALVLRFYEAYGGEATSAVTTFLPVARAVVCTALEDEGTELLLSGGTIQLVLKPFQLTGKDLFQWTKEVTVAVESSGFDIIRTVIDNYSANTMIKHMGNGCLHTVVTRPHDLDRAM
ncbi:hypothetical protein HPB49_010096 [Dermacentor silvarum]|uniref:Uncharacterized protein n=1 Tax=Dermacentor silvarum TaxID=543639 RepID=A0ACB8CKJ9_DERSI|nr:hypothetical protein HPB49_010096 [Dermacentor silvarum]